LYNHPCTPAFSRFAKRSRGKKTNEIGRSRGGLGTKIHVAVDAYGYPVNFILSEGQEADCSYAIKLIEPINF
jgi:hypothetical protein